MIKSKYYYSIFLTWRKFKFIDSEPESPSTDKKSKKVPKPAPEPIISRSGRKIKSVIPFNAKDYRYRYKKPVPGQVNQIYHGNTKKTKKTSAKKIAKKRAIALLTPALQMPLIGETIPDVIKPTESITQIEDEKTNGNHFYPVTLNEGHLCAVCSKYFKTESQLFNHLDNGGKRVRYVHNLHVGYL